MLKAVGFHKELESMTQLVSSSPVHIYVFRIPTLFLTIMSCTLVVYQLKSMMTTNSKYNLREDHTMLNGNNGVCFHLLMFIISDC